MFIRALPWCEPAEAFAPWADAPYVAWLDSGGAASPRSRTSYIGIEPFRVIAADSGDPFGALAAELARHADPGPGPTPFAGGAIGFLGYELAAHLERVPVHREGGLGLPDMLVGFYDVVMAFDHARRRAWLCSSGLPERGHAQHRRAVARAQAVLAQLQQPPVPPRPVPPLRWEREVSREDHRRAIERVLDYIRAGDIYQANYTTRFTADLPPGVAPAAIHAALRAGNPAPFGAYLGCGAGRAVASASPERFLRLDTDGLIESRPIKGTRPRHADPAQDAAEAAALRASAKDRAENLMIVDLLRHDIGRVASIGSVQVPSLWEVESFPGQHHLVSCVQGQLRPGLGPVDLLRAAFPGGSITGAPKIRAMQIIHALEPVPRGPYCGAVAWIGWDGAMDSSIAIRTLTIAPGRVAAQAGGGIVLDSQPDAEFEEMMVKLRPLLRALGPVPE